MEFLREYGCQDGNGRDRVIHSRQVTHVEGDARIFAIVAEGSGDCTTVIFTHEEMTGIIAEYERYKPLAVAGFLISGRPASFLRSLGRVLQRRPRLAAAVQEADTE